MVLTEKSNGPLQGVEVLDFTQAIAGPFATRILSDLGAEVIKVEPKWGDLVRNLNPVDDSGFSPTFQHGSAGKKGVVLDLTTDAGLEVALDLASRADVVVENFSPGVASRLGIGFDDVSAVSEGVIYCSISSFGQTGPLSQCVGADPIGQAMSGMVHAIGDPDRGPRMAMNAIADTSTATHAAVAILAALVGRNVGDPATHIDIGMTDVMLAMDCMNVPTAAATGSEPYDSRAGSNHPSICPFGVFEAQDGYVLIEGLGQGEGSLWARICSAIGRSEWIDDSKTSTPAARLQNREMVDDELARWVWEFGNRDSVVEHLRSHRVLVAPVLSPLEAVQEAQMVSRGDISSIPHPYGLDSTVDVIRTPYRFSSYEVATRGAPKLGQHTEEILRSRLGYSVERIAELRGDGAI